jgi:spermidine synthase
MGMSLPLLARATVREIFRAGRTLGFFYGLNVLGASGGALVTPWLLLRFMGVRGTVVVAACANLLAGALALASYALRNPRSVPRAPEAPLAPEGGVEIAGSKPLGLWITLYALSGFCALGLEILWFRVIDVAVRSTAFTFGTLLALYLLGSGLGSLCAASSAQKSTRPLRAYLLLEIALLVYAGLAFAALTRLPEETPVVGAFIHAWAQESTIRLGKHFSPGAIARWYLVLPGLLFGVPTLLMGATFPLLQRAVQDDLRTTGRKVGLLQAANLIGCLAGSLLVGLALLGALGSAGTLKLLVAFALLFSAIGWRFYGARSGFGAAAAVTLVVLVSLPTERQLWLRIHGTGDPRAIVVEDRTGVSALVPERKGRWAVWTNGKKFSSLPYGGFHTLLGAAPAIVHPSPEHVMIIGLGSGDTAWAVGCRGGETRTIDVYEICGSNQDVLRLLPETFTPPDLGRLLQDRRVRNEVADGRHRLEQGAETYDIIEVDALWPTNAYAGTVYSVEFFRAGARRLNPGGLMCSWAPTPRVIASFSQAFPYVVSLDDDQILLGSHEPISVDRALWKERVKSPEVSRYLGRERVQAILEGLRTATRLESRPLSGGELNEDLFPRDEFRTP